VGVVPVQVTRLDAKGCIDERHPLCFGVVGVHGKPGPALSSALVASATMILAVGVADWTVLCCDENGFQVRSKHATQARKPCLN